ncbi:MAG: hypothetical protein EZS28_034910, partial [Streblomastix strix]
MKESKEFNSMKRWILDKQQGLISIVGNISVPPDACVLWAENGENHEYIQIIGESLDIFIKEASDKIEEANKLTDKLTAGIPKLLIDASNIFLTSKNKLKEVDRESVLKNAQKGVKEKNDGLIFSQIILALDNEIKRQPDKAIPQIITEICRQVTKREDWQTSIPTVPATWTGKDKENKIKGMHLIWGAITLLSVLQNPLTLTQHEIEIFRQKLMLGPLIPEFIGRDQDMENSNIIIREIDGEEIDCIGVICGRFTQADVVQQMFDKIESLKPPEFPPLSGNQENNNSISIKDLLNQVYDKLDNSVNKFQTIKNPSELNQLLIQIPSLSSQIIIAAQCSENQNIYKLVSKLGILTIICQELQKSKENMQIFQVQIQKSVEGCYQVWAQLIKAGITPPAELNLSRDILNRIQNSGTHIQNIQVVNIPKSQLQRGSWFSQAEKVARIDGQQNPELSEAKMALAIRDTIVEKPLQEELNEGEEFIPKKVNINEIQTQLVQMDITEILKGKKVEDLLIMEYEAVKRAPKGINNKKKVSEGRVVFPLDGTQDRHEANSIENRPEIIEMHNLSQQIQSLLYAEIVQFLKPFEQNIIIPYTLQDTEVSIMVDISSSMTKLSKMKQMGAMVLVSGISEI